MRLSARDIQSGIVDHVKRAEGLLCIALGCTVGFGSALASRAGAAESVLSVRRLEIKDSVGRTTIVLGTDSDGTAEILLTDATGKLKSTLAQYRDGTTEMRFGGPENRPSVVISAPQLGVGPRVYLQGNSYDQVIYLGPSEV